MRYVLDIVLGILAFNVALFVVLAVAYWHKPDLTDAELDRFEKLGELR